MIVSVPVIGKNGLIQDAPIGDLPPDVFTYSENVRFRDGMAELMYGHSELSDNGVSGFSPTHLVYNKDALDAHWLMFGDTKAYTSNQGVASWSDVTRASGDYSTTGGGFKTADRWVSTVLSGLVVATNNLDVPQAWPSPSSIVKLIDLANWTADTSCKSIRAHKNFLIALNITEYNAGTFTVSAYNQHRVLWSHPAEPGAVPSSWDVTDTTKDAGWVDLDGPDHVIDGGSMRDLFVIYKERSTFLMQYIGGQFIWRFTKAFNDSGILAQNCWTEVNGQHVVLTASDLIIHDGFQAKSILNGKYRRWLFQNIETTEVEKCFLVKQWYFNEVWVCFPSQGATWCDKALVWNYVDNTFSLRDLPDVSYAGLGPADDAADSTWNNDTQVWDADNAGWGSNEFTPDLQRVVLATPVTDQLFLADSTTKFDGTAINGTLERTGLTFGQPDKFKFVRGVRPRFYGNGNDVTITLGSQDELHGAVTWGTAQTFSIGSQYKSDHLVSGRYIAFKIESTSDYWRLESLDFDIELGEEY